MPGPVNHHHTYHLPADETFRLVYQLAVRAIAAENGGMVEPRQVHQLFSTLEKQEQLPDRTFRAIALDVEGEMGARIQRNRSERIAAEMR